eukprot:CAMPEP_0201148640 /NCGR_PEP_ID=MMETSP0851-20130426/10062_1 /ASSEMBLY_ACC=CAM_ASM_000631 /TAXON_ID=183588 /ORGANISM="Pseudo-nitzschia fraudulenta, Strain WWA7" /LENGTH=532 /DNA_ID=CAMNT_0047424843 /DNA_START=343 /DNA_END=1941 /DNA_ORIENTATION=-
MALLIGSKMEGVEAFCCSSKRQSPSPTKPTRSFGQCHVSCSLLQLSAATSRMNGDASSATTTRTASTGGSTSPPPPQPAEQSKETPADNNKKSTQGGTDATKKNKNDDGDAGVVGNWENLHGNWVLRPTFGGDLPGIDDELDFAANSQQPRAVIHFLGGALVGKAPHVTYRYLLEKLAAEGFLVVATPFDLSFDHLVTCDDVLTRFEAVAPTLAKQYGALPVVGIGHSCGALLQVLISSLFPDTPRAANALLSFNNKPVSEAVPFFEEFFAPAFSSLAVGPEVAGGDGSTTTTGGGGSSRGPSSNDSLAMGLKLAKAASKGSLPSDELLEEAQSVFGSGLRAVFPSLPIPVPPFAGGRADSFKIPSEVRETYTKWAEPSVTALSESGILPIIHEAIVSLEQIPKLIDEVADGARDFNPTPDSVRSAAGKAYRPRRTLIIGYNDDPIDESDEIEEVLKEARSITRMRRPMVEIDVERTTLGGGHAAPLLAPPLEVAGKAEDLLGLEASQERLGYTEAAATVQDLVRWLEEGNL